MASCLLFTPRREEGQKLARAIHDRAAYMTEQALDCVLFQRAIEASGWMQGHCPQAIVWDAGESAALPALAEARHGCPDAFLLILARADTSPLVFLRPDIAPNSLILRPLQPSEVERVSCEILRAVFPGAVGNFVIRRKGESQNVPWEQIYYFESREKRLYVRLRGEEIGFSGTLDALSEKLPAQFRRCHRGFIVNLDKVARLRFSENLICLWDGLEVPMSRGYKQSMKEYGHGRD